MNQSIAAFIRRLNHQLPPKLLPIAQKIDTLNEMVGQVMLWLVLVTIALGTWNALGRFVGKAIGQNLTSNSLIESQWYLFDVFFLGGAAYTLKHNEHVRVDIFYHNWSPRRRAIADLVGTMLFLIPFCVLVIVSSWGAIVQSWAIGEVSPDPGGLPRYPIKTVIIISCVLLICQGIAEIIKNWAKLTGHLPIDSPTTEQMEIGDKG
jgi:TRAP-type mannitol/chloroaromatic compound transport system permease small subunit